MADKTVQKQIESRKLHPVAKFPMRVMTVVDMVLYQNKVGVKFNWKIDKKKYRNTSYILISNHVSRVDHCFTLIPFYPDTINFIMGYNEIFRSHLHFILSLMSIVPKKNFTPDLYSMRQILRIAKEGGRLALMPEGMSSISGHNQPVQLGTAQLLKKLGIPVLYTKISGGYLQYPKYTLDERPGKSEVDIDIMFTPEELKTLSEEEMTDRMNLLLWHDDYEWQAEHHVKFNCKGRPANNMHQLLFWCPTCHENLSMASTDDTLYCKKCGCGIRLNDYYEMTPLTDDTFVPTSPSYWYDLEREWVKRQVAKDGFYLEDEVELGILPTDHYLKNNATSEIVGKGVLRMDRDGLHYRGTKSGVEYSFDIPIKSVPTYGMCTDCSRFYTFVGPDFTEFYPKNPDSAMYWMIATEEMHRLMGGKWADFKEDHPAKIRLANELKRCTL